MGGRALSYKMKHTTSMWHFNESNYRFQTDCKKICKSLKRRRKFRLVGWGDNTDLWIFQASFPTTQKALYVLNNLTTETAILRVDCWVVEH
jgi:hypothetical protein